MKLSEQKCVPCEGGMPPMSEEGIIENSKHVPTWTRQGMALTKKFTFKDFKEAVFFVNKVAVIAEAEGHHPDISISYNKVELSLSTHAIGGLSVNDFIVAAKIDSISL